MTMWKEAEALQEEICAIRRSLHQIPEVASDLPKTRDFVTRKLDALGIPYTLNRHDSGLMAVIRGAHPGRTIALRADMDALPVEEANDVPYRSCHPGAMHACGHDAHTAMLLGAAAVLSRHKEDLHGNVKLLFQANEEGVSGALNLCAEQDLSDCAAVFGTHIGHLQPGTYPSGSVICVPGPFMASADNFMIRVRGKGFHGSTPNQGIDPITIASHIVLALQAIQAREVAGTDVVALTICSVVSGTTFNIGPDDAVIQGTLRTFDPAVRSFVLGRMEEIIRAQARCFRGSAELTILNGTGPVINNPDMAAVVARCAGELLGEDRVFTRVDQMCMVSEDISVYLERLPGAFFFLTSATEENGTNYPHHNPHFNIDEDVLWKGTAMFLRLTEEFLCR